MLRFGLLEKCRRNSEVAHAPRRHIGPGVELFFRPFHTLVLVTRRARIWNVVLLCHGRINEAESVASDVHISNRLLNVWHMTCNAVVTSAARLVVCMGVQHKVGVRPLLIRRGTADTNSGKQSPVRYSAPWFAFAEASVRRVASRPFAVSSRNVGSPLD